VTILWRWVRTPYILSRLAAVLLSKRVILAAARIALFYVVLVALAFALLVSAFVGWRGMGIDIVGMAEWLSVPCALAFLLLAAARRWGFVTLWAILGAFWCWVVLDSQSLRSPRQLPLVFMVWSAFALPLWIIGQAGIPAVSPRRFSPSMVMLICWCILLVTPRLFGLPQIEVFPPRNYGLADLVSWIWTPLPLILSAFAMRHVWRGTANAVAA